MNNNKKLISDDPVDNNQSSTMSGSTNDVDKSTSSSDSSNNRIHIDEDIVLEGNGAMHITDTPDVDILEDPFIAKTKNGDDENMVLDPDDSLRDPDIVDNSDPYYKVNLNRGDVGKEAVNTFDENPSNDKGPNDPQKTLSSKTVAGEFVPGEAGHPGIDEDTE